MPGPVTNASNEENSQDTRTTPNLNPNQRLLDNFQKSSGEATASSLIEGITDKDLLGTILVLAASKGYTNIVNYLINLKEIDVNYKDKQYGDTALLAAANNGRTETVNALIELGATIITNSGGYTALSAAVISRNIETVKALIGKFKDMPIGIDQQNKDGDTALTLAAFIGSTDIVELLLNSEATINHRNKASKTALDLAAWAGKTDTVKLLLNKGAQISAISKNNETALHLAAEEGHLATVKFLLDNGADINIKNSGKDTALDLAKKARKELPKTEENTSKISEMDEVINLLIEQQKKIERQKPKSWLRILSGTNGNNEERQALLSSQPGTSIYKSFTKDLNGTSKG